MLNQLFEPLREWVFYSSEQGLEKAFVTVQFRRCQEESRSGGSPLGTVTGKIQLAARTDRVQSRASIPRNLLA